MILLITFEEHQGSMLKVLSLFDELGRDYTFLIGYDQFFFSMTEIREFLAEKLSVPIDEIELEEV